MRNNHKFFFYFKCNTRNEKEKKNILFELLYITNNFPYISLLFLFLQL